MEIWHVLLAVFTLVTLAAPLVLGREGDYALDSRSAGRSDGPLGARRAASLAAIRDLEYEHLTGRIADGEFQPLRDRYVAEAAAVLGEIEASRSEELKAIEKKVAERRKALNPKK